MWVQHLVLNGIFAAGSEVETPKLWEKKREFQTGWSFNHHVPRRGSQCAKCFRMGNHTGSGSQDKTKSKFGLCPKHCYFMLRGGYAEFNAALLALGIKQRTCIAPPLHLHTKHLTSVFGRGHFTTKLSRWPRTNRYNKCSFLWPGQDTTEKNDTDIEKSFIGKKYLYKIFGLSDYIKRYTFGI